MDQDPELDVTLSDGRQVATFQIVAIAGREAWAIVEPRAPRRVIRGCAAALDVRQRVDTQIAARLAAGWVPVDRRLADAPGVAPTPLPPDLGVQISSLLEALTHARRALRAADPSGQLWAACHVFQQQTWRFGIGAPGARFERAHRERRLGELAEQAGDRAAAILHYRAALAAHQTVGVARRVARLVAPAARAAAASRSHGVAVASPPGTAPADSTGLVAAPERSWVHGPLARTSQEDDMTARIQIVGRLPVALSRRVRAAAQQRHLSLNAFLIDALTQALGARRVTAPKERAR